MSVSSTPQQVSSIRSEKHVKQEQLSGNMAQQYQPIRHLAYRLLLAKCAMLGLYAIALKLFTGAVNIDLSLVTITAFICWSVSIACTLFAIIPPQNGTTDSNNASETKATFDQAIQQKQALLIPSLVLFITGFLVIFWNLLI